MTLPTRVVLLTRAGCHLCETAQATIEGLCAQQRVGWRAIDIDDDEALATRYTAHVPVVFVDGELHGYWFVDEAALRRDLVSGRPAPVDDSWQPPTNRELS